MGRIFTPPRGPRGPRGRRGSRGRRGGAGRAGGGGGGGGGGGRSRSRGREGEERVPWLVPGSEDVLPGGSVVVAGFERPPGRGAVVLVDEPLVPGGRVHPDRGDDDLGGDVMQLEDAVGYRVRDAPRHARLGGAPGEVRVFVTLDRSLVDEQGERLDRQAGLQHGHERDV